MLFLPTAVKLNGRFVGIQIICVPSGIRVPAKFGLAKHGCIFSASPTLCISLSQSKCSVAQNMVNICISYILYRRQTLMFNSSSVILVNLIMNISVLTNIEMVACM